MTFQICDGKINYSINNTGTTEYPSRKKKNEIGFKPVSVNINQNTFQMYQMLNFKLSEVLKILEKNMV